MARNMFILWSILNVYGSVIVFYAILEHSNYYYLSENNDQSTDCNMAKSLYIMSRYMKCFSVFSII